MRHVLCTGGALLIIALIWFLQKEIGPTHKSEELGDNEFRQFDGDPSSTPQKAQLNDQCPPPKSVSMAQYHARWEKIYQDNWKRTTEYLQTRYNGNFTQVLPWNYNEATYLWDYFPPAYNCDERERVGRMSDGGKWICRFRDIERLPVCNVLSFGIDGEWRSPISLKICFALLKAAFYLLSLLFRRIYIWAWASGSY